MHLNRECHFPDLAKLFIQTDLTGQVRDRLSWVAATVESLLEVTTLDTAPRTSIGPHCFHPYTCPFKTHCWEGVREPTIFVIPRLHPSRARELISKGMTSILDIPADYPLSETQGQYVRQFQSGQPQILWPAINDLLSTLEQPLYFLDIQTTMDIIPRHKGLRPLDPYPFEYSLQMLLGDEQVELAGYLHADASDPRPLVAQSLCNEIGPKGTVVVFHGSAERRALKNLAWDVSPFRGDLLSIFDHIFDLEQIFQHFYFDPRFGGSTALQDICTILFPDLAPESPEIRNTAEAQLAWERLIGAETEDEKEPLVHALKGFSSQNSAALFRIYQLLRARSLDPFAAVNLSGNDGAKHRA